MLRSFSNRVARNNTIKYGKSTERTFSSKPPANKQPQTATPATKQPLTTSRPQAKKPDGSGFIALGLTALCFLGPVAYIKLNGIKLSPENENVLGSLLGTQAVLFLRPAEKAEEAVTENDVSPPLYNPSQVLNDLTEIEKNDVLNEESSSKESSFEESSSTTIVEESSEQQEVENSSPDAEPSLIVPVEETTEEHSADHSSEVELVPTEEEVAAGIAAVTSEGCPVHITAESSVNVPRVPYVHTDAIGAQLQSDAVKNMLEDMAIQSVALRKELEMTLLKDLETLDEAGLKARISDLASEFVARAKWENLRLSQALKQVEAEVSRKYLSLLVQQRSELDFHHIDSMLKKEQEMIKEQIRVTEETKKGFESHLYAVLNAQREEADDFLQNQLKAQATEIESQLQDQMNHHVAVMRESHCKELLEIQTKVEDVAADIKSFNDIIDLHAASHDSSIFLHQESAAILALETKLKRSEPFSKHIQEVKRLAELSKDVLILAAVDGVSKELQMKGALTIPELKIRFNVMKNEVRKASFVPESANNIFGEMLGYTWASVVAPPRGWVQGKTVDDIVARTQYFLDHDMLIEALKELDGVTGYPRVLMSDWINLAEERLTVDLTAKVLRANAVLRHASFKTGP